MSKGFLIFLLAARTAGCISCAPPDGECSLVVANDVHPELMTLYVSDDYGARWYGPTPLHLRRGEFKILRMDSATGFMRAVAISEWDEVFLSYSEMECGNEDDVLWLVNSHSRCVDCDERF
jgi:hypothetical protein